MQDFSRLANHELRAKVRDLASKDRAAVVALAGHLGEVESRGLHLEWGFSSLWDFCDRELGLKDGVAHLRITLARLLRRRPEVRELILAGRLGQCAATELIGVVDRDDFDEILANALGKGRQAVKDMLVSSQMAPEKRRDKIRRIAPAVSGATPDLFEGTNMIDLSPNASNTPGAAVNACQQGDVVERKIHEPKPQDLKTHEIKIYANEELVQKVRHLQDLEGTDDLNKILLKALDVYLSTRDPLLRHTKRLAKKAAHGIGKSTKKRQSNPRRVPIALSDEVRVEADQQCAYVAPDGTRCSARRMLQDDHVLPWALGGSSSDKANVRCYCRAHNLMMARRFFPGKVPKPVYQKGKRLNNGVLRADGKLACLGPEALEITRGVLIDPKESCPHAL